MKNLLSILLLFLFSFQAKCQNLVLKLNLKKEMNLNVQYYSSNFIIEDGKEFVDFKIDTNLQFKKQRFEYILEIPYNSDYLIELYDSITKKYKYLQISTIDALETNNININNLDFNDNNRLVIYFNEVKNHYVQYLTIEP